MPYPQLDRHTLTIHPLCERESKVRIDRDMILPGTLPGPLAPAAGAVISKTAEKMRQARAAGRPIMLAFGAHAIKNGLGAVLIHLLEKGWIQHLATNGAGIIHDWEFAFLGESSEDVRGNTAAGTFGLWEETGYHLNLAILLGAFDGLGYGESVGRLIERGCHTIPGREALLEALHQGASSADGAERAGAAGDLLAAVERHALPRGVMEVAHRWRGCSVQAAAYRLGIPFTAHPMIGHDIIYTHPLNCGAAVGRTAQRDFLSFAHNVSRLQGSVYLSIGSAVMSPMVFEKSMAMAQNLALQEGRHIDGHTMIVVDLAESRWDWSAGEPPPESPDYYLRYCKTFSRMGGTMHYATADNRDFLLGLCRALEI